MIRFHDVSKHYPVKDGVKVVLDDITAEFPRGKSVAIMGPNGAGKSTLLRLFSGAEMPDAGFIERNATVSWPLGFRGGLHGSLSGRENVAFIARIYGIDFIEMLDFVEDFADIGANMGEQVKTYSSGMQARVAFGMSMAISFDYYLIDEVIAVGDPAFRRKSKNMLLKKLESATVILVSHSRGLMKEFCDHGLVLLDGKLIEFPTIDEAIDFYESEAAVGTLHLT